MELEQNCSACNNRFDFTKDRIKYIDFDGENCVKLFYHLECETKIFNYLEIILKNQGFLSYIKYHIYVKLLKNNNSNFLKIQKKHKELMYNNFINLSRQYNLTFLIEQIQLDDPIYSILLVISTWKL